MSFLQHLGKVLRNILHIGEQVASIAEPFVDAAFPAIAPLYNAALAFAVAEEATAATVTGSGPQKLAALTLKLIPDFEAFATANNLVFDQTKLSDWASVFADTMNKLPFTPKPVVAKPVA